MSKIKMCYTFVTQSITILSNGNKNKWWSNHALEHLVFMGSKKRKNNIDYIANLCKITKFTFFFKLVCVFWN